MCSNAIAYDSVADAEALLRPDCAVPCANDPAAIRSPAISAVDVPNTAPFACADPRSTAGPDVADTDEIADLGGRRRWLLLAVRVSDGDADAFTLFLWRPVV